MDTHPADLGMQEPNRGPERKSSWKQDLKKAWRIPFIFGLAFLVWYLVGESAGVLWHPFRLLDCIIGVLVGGLIFAIGLVLRKRNKDKETTQNRILKIGAFTVGSVVLIVFLAFAIGNFVERNNIRQLKEMFRVPSTSEIGLPVYPGAKTFSGSTDPPDSNDPHGSKGVRMTTKDSPEQVTQWYKQVLSAEPGYKEFPENPDAHVYLAMIRKGDVVKMVGVRVGRNSPDPIGATVITLATGHIDSSAPSTPAPPPPTPAQ